MINRYPGTCETCRTRVPAEAGTVTKLRGAWTTYCAAHSPAARPTITERTLSAAGEVRTPYDPEALPLLRGAPGARWDGDDQVWRWSVTDADLTRTIECARALRLDVAPELLARAAAGSPRAAAAVDRARAAGLYPYQLDGVRWLVDHDRALLADDMGLGKTAQTLLALPGDTGALVVAPASLLRVWEAECRRWRPDLTPCIVRGRGSARTPNPSELVICSYESLPTAAVIGSISAVTLVIDECHRAKGRDTARAKALRALGLRAQRVWGITGTPLLGRPFDLWGVLTSLGTAEAVFGKMSAFFRLFSATKNRWGGWEFGAIDPSVPERLRRVMIRRTKAEALPNLPAKTRRYIPCDAGRDLPESVAEYLDAGVLPPFEMLAAARAATAKARIPAALDLIGDYEDAGTPLLVFSAHRAPIDALADREGWAVITGDTPIDTRADIVARFQAGALRGVGLTIQAGGVGLTLTYASHVLFVDRDWTPAINAQAEDRVHRIGQKNAVDIAIMQSTHALDRRVAEIIEAKIALIDAAIESCTTLSESHVDDVAARAEARARAIAEAAEAQARQARDAEGERLAGLLARETERAAQARRATPPISVCSADQRDAILDAVDTLRAVCDGAKTRDEAGFAAGDVALRHSLGAWLRGAPDNSPVWCVAERMLSRYRHTQLGSHADRIWGDP